MSDLREQAESKINDAELEYPLDDDAPEGYRCRECGGSGLSMEGWDCEECDGTGYWDI